MKRKVLSVLGVLMSTAALSACSKASAGADSGSGKNSIISRKINIQSDKSRK